MAEDRLALIIANTHYQDKDLSQLIAPAQDAEALAQVLQAADIGDFAVQVLLNQPSYKVKQDIESLFDDRRRTDLVLLYFSGHGIKDMAGRLYFATTDTQRKRLRSTGISAHFVNDVMRHSRSRRQILLLDCCYSGAFARGMIVRANRDVGTGEYFKEGRGQIVLTASDALQYAFEGDEVTGAGVRSVFTHILVEGLQTGQADLDGDGWVNVDELYDYIQQRMADEMPEQKPEQWNFGGHGKLIIARNPQPIARVVKSFPALQHAIGDRRPWVHEIMRELERLLQIGDEETALTVQKTLLQLIGRSSQDTSVAVVETLSETAETTLMPSPPTKKTRPISLPKTETISRPIPLSLRLIPDGEFLMGSDPKIDREAYGCELPQHRLYLPDFYIAKTPVTNEQYQAFTRATGYQTVAEERGWSWVWCDNDWQTVSGANWRHPQGPASDIVDKTDHPVVQMSHQDAVAFCRWLSLETDRPFRLPSEAEWEKAARGDDGRIYPWGNRWDSGHCNTGESGIGDTTPVTAYPVGASPYKVLDLIGNVWEWTASLWGEQMIKPSFGYPYNATDGREDMTAGDGVYRILRGGSWYYLSDLARCAVRYWYSRDRRIALFGFRVAVSAN